MEHIEIIVVGLIICGALVYLYKTFKPKKKTGTGGGCGCGTSDCKVPKPQVDRSTNKNQ